MRLQIKDSGSWRNVCGFDQGQQAEVMKAGAFLLAAIAPTKTVLRVAEGDKVLSYCDAPTYQWRLVGPPA